MQIHPSYKKNRLQPAFSTELGSGLLEVLANQACHLKHGNLNFAEDFFELGIGIDHALVDFILKFVLLDVDPQLLDHFSACQRG